MTAILAWIEKRGRSVLYSEIEDAFGRDAARPAFDRLLETHRLRAVFPEAKPGNSGRQFWEIVKC